MAIPQRNTIRDRELVAMMALVMSLQALAIDSMLPALGAMAHDLGATDPNRRQLVVGLFLLFSGIGSLVPGTLADRFGRKPVLLVHLGGYLVCTLASALSQTFSAMLVARAMGGLFSSGLAVLPATVLRDRFEGDRMARMQSTMGMVFLIVPMLAPSLGQAVLAFAGWRWIFGIMAAMALAIALWVVLRLPETLDPGMRRPLALHRMPATIAMILINRESSGYVFGGALIMGALLGYINSAQQLVAEHFGLGARFPLVFGAMALLMMSANFLNTRIVERLGSRHVAHTGLLAYIAIAIVHLAVAGSGETAWAFVPLLAAAMFCSSLFAANAGSLALQPFARSAGAASSAQTFVRTGLGALIGSLIGQAFDGTPRPLVAAMLAAGCGALALVLFSERGRLFGRGHRPHA